MPYKDPKNPKLIAYKKAYNKKYREENREYFRKAYSKWAKENPDKQIERSKKYIINNRLKTKARGKVFYATKTNTLIRPNKCSECLVKCKPEADHADYNKPLDVVWLCKSCHTIATIKRKEV